MIGPRHGSRAERSARSPVRFCVTRPNGLRYLARVRRDRPTACLGACAALWLATTDVSAAAVPASLQLEWSAPASCPQTPDVRVRIESALRRPTRTGGPSTTRVKASVTADTRGFALVLETRTAGNAVDVRRMHDRRCSVLADAAAVIVATAIDEVDPNRAPPPGAPPTPPRPRPNLPPGAAPREPADLPPGTASSTAAPPPAPADLPPGTGPDATTAATTAATTELSPGTAADAAAGPPPALPSEPATDLSPGTAPIPTAPGPTTAPAIAASIPAPDPELPAPAPAPTPPRPRLRGALRITALADLGSTPELSGGLSGGGGLLGARWRLHLAAVWVAPRVTRPLPDLDIRVGLLAAQLRGCAVPTLGPLEFDVCLGLEAGGLRGSSSGDALADPRVDWQPIVGAIVGPALVWPFARRLALVLQADLVLALARPQFAVQGHGIVHHAPPAVGRALLGLEVRIP